MATGGSPKVTLQILAETKKARSEIRDFKRTMERSWTEINSMLEIGQKAFQAVSGAISGVVSVSGDLIAAADKQIKAENKLFAALNRRGQASEAVISRLNRFNAAMQQRLGYGDEELLQLQTTLSAMGVNADAMEKATKGTLALAEVMGGELNDKAKVVAKALNGDVGALKEYGIVARDASDASRQLSSMFSLAESQGGTLGQQLKTLSANYGDLEEALGRQFTESKAFKDVLGIINGLILDMTGSLDSGKMNLVEETMKAIAQAAASILTAFVTLRNILPDVIESTKTLGRNIWQDMKFATGFADKPGDPNAKGRTGIGMSEFDRALLELVGRLQGITGGRRSATGRVRTGSGGGGGSAGATAGSSGFAQMTAAEDQAIFDGGDRIAAELEHERAMRSLREQEQHAHVDTMVALYHREVEAYMEAMQERQDASSDDRSKLKDDMMERVAVITQSGLANAFAGIGEAMAQENLRIGDIIKSALGAMIKSIGMMLIQLGTAGVLAGTLGTVVPVFASLTGGPLGVAAGSAALAGGTAMVALGSALSARGGSGGSGSLGGSTGAPRTTPGSTPSLGIPEEAGIPSLSSSEPRQTIVNVNFSRSIVGDKREVARAVRDALDADQRVSIGAGG